MTHFVIYQLAPDHATYGADAGKFIVTSEDLEHEISGPMSEQDARLLASALNGCQMITERWERGRLDEAARVCAAVVADATANTRTSSVPDSIEPLLLATAYIGYVKERAPELHREADGTPSIEKAIRDAIAGRAA